MGETSHVSPPVTDLSDIFQCDGNETITSQLTNDSCDNTGGENVSENSTIFNTDDEVENEPVPANLNPVAGQTVMPGIPVTMDVNISNTQSTSILPLCMMLNARSVYNKVEHLKDLYQLGPDLIIVSETFEHKNKLL